MALKQVNMLKGKRNDALFAFGCSEMAFGIILMSRTLYAGMSGSGGARGVALGGVAGSGRACN